ncbi:prolyl hydroxylase family protein [Taibaiella koreensis]|uniref:prolyl hydroxylase family protein n=1 Tax=Taibaiella koreensis TaxID=1268548 RepID=UPI000E59997E|nr:2OG-Fe(II) oxygenase [Taibaiella koreensis]
MSYIKETSEIYTIDQFLSEAECDQLIAQAETTGFQEAKVNIDGGQKMMKMIRDNERILYTDQLMAFKLWKKLRPYIRPTIGNTYAIGLNEMFRFYKYSPGQRFKMHRDGRYQRNETECSYYTFMVYLNDDYEGGQTRFESGEYVAPRKGTALIFEHSLRHEGARLEAGNKYVLRSDIMYKLRNNG